MNNLIDLVALLVCASVLLGLVIYVRRKNELAAVEVAPRPEPRGRSPLPPPPPPSNEERRLGPYRIGAKIAEGGIANVYHALGPNGERLALKLPLSAGDQPAQARLMNEGKLIQELNRRFPHAPIVRCYGSGRDLLVTPSRRHGVDCSYVALEFLTGKPLNEVLKEKANRPLSQRDISVISRDIATALEAVHKAGFVHLDVCPQNVIVHMEHGRITSAKLIDFSHSVSSGPTGTRLTSFQGHKEYGAPEAWSDGTEVVSEKSDMYSFGIMLYHLGKGTLPYEAKTVNEWKRVHREEPLPPLGHVGKPLEQIIPVLTKKQPEQRVLSAGDVYRYFN